MSHRLMEELLAIPAGAMPGYCRTVLMWLSYRANEDGMAWPSQDDIARATGMSQRQVRRALKVLIASRCIVPQGSKQRGVVIYGDVTQVGHSYVLCRTPVSGVGRPCPGTPDVQGTQVGRRCPPGRTQLCPTKKEDKEDTLRARPQEPPRTAAPLEGAAPRAQTAQPEKRITVASETPEQRKARAQAFAAILARSRGETVSA